MELQPSKGLAIFEQRGIRRLWHDNRWWFSVIDVISVLAERHDGRQAWQDLKRRISAEGAAETVAKCHNFKMRAADGKMRNTDCADTETLLRIIQSVPSPKAEPFKQWLAQVGTERIAEADDPEFAIEEWRRRAVASYIARGYSEAWAEKRVELILTRNVLTHEWTIRGIAPEEIPILTDRLHMGSFGITIDDHKGIKGYPVTKDGKHIGNLQNGMILSELAITGLASALTTEQHQIHHSQGREQIERDIDIGARAAAAARKAIEEVTRHPVVSTTNAMPDANTLWNLLPPVGADGDDA